MNQKMILLLVIVLIIAATLAVGIFLPSGQPNGLPVPAPTAADYKNATYVIEGVSTTLVNGYAEAAVAPGSASKLVTQYFGNEATGDLTGRGTEDAAFLVTQSGGGSGTFFYVVAALQTANGFVGTNAVLLGDRIAPQTTEIRNGEIIVNYADRNPGEPMTAKPSLGVTKYFRVENGVLAQVGL